MIVRALALAAGVTGAAGLSQFPAFSQAYQQRLGGAVDELSRVVDQFDADAAAEGLSRAQALEDLSSGSGFAARRATSMAETIARHDRLSGDLAALEGAGPFMRAKHATRFTDSDVAQKAWDNFQPALPANFEGAVFAGTGFVGGWALVRLVFGLLGGLFGRRRRA